MDAVKLDKRLFQQWDELNHHLIFSDSLRRKYYSLPKAEQEIFDPEQFISEQTEKLFNTYHYILITPNNKVFGQSGDDIELIKERIDRAYETAIAIK